MRYLPALLLLSVFATAAQAEPATRADRAQIVAWARDFFADPYSLRSTEISDRAVVRGVPVICAAFNAKNLAGGYVGIYQQPFEVTPGGLVPGQRSARVNTATCRDPSIVWRPFPELASIR